MSEADQRRERISAKIAAAQERLKRDGEAAATPAPQRAQLPDAYPPESYRSLATEYPWLALAAGAGVGLLVGALLPRRFGGRLGQRALGAAMLAGELGLALGKRAGEVADEAGREGLQRANDSTATARQRATQGADKARRTALALTREAIALTMRARK